MDNIELYQTLRIEILPSPETKDQEVRFIADGIDLIERHWGNMMGLDPTDILVEPCGLRGSVKPNEVTIARCNCGMIGCGRVQVVIRRSGDYVAWECAEYTDIGQPSKLYFFAKRYDAEVERALQDHSQETPS